MNKEIEELTEAVCGIICKGMKCADCDRNCECRMMAEAIFNEGYRKQSGWISVEERLPERTMPPKDVLVYHNLGCGMFVDRAWYSYDRKRWCSVLGMKLKVTHWMPLPEPPKGDENDA